MSFAYSRPDPDTDTDRVSVSASASASVSASVKVEALAKADTTKPKAKTKEAKHVAGPGPFVAFDLEMSALLPVEWPADGSSPVRILCAASARVVPAAPPVPATFATPAARASAPPLPAALPPPETRVWHGAATPWMTPHDLCAFIDYLWAAHTRGEMIITWGGVASDWRVLAAEVRAVSPAAAAKCVAMARQHIDIAFAAAASLGGMMGLRAACAGMCLEAKHPMASALVPVLWAMGQWPYVLAHVTADAVATAAVYERMFHADTPTPQLTWHTARGAAKTWYAPYVVERGAPRLLTVQECLALPKATPKFSVPANLEPSAMAEWLA